MLFSNLTMLKYLRDITKLFLSTWDQIINGHFTTTMSRTETVSGNEGVSLLLRDYLTAAHGIRMMKKREN